MLDLGVGIWDWYPPQTEKIARGPGDEFHANKHTEGASSIGQIKEQLASNC